MLPGTKHEDDMDKVDDVLLTLHGKSGNVEIDPSELVERTIFAIRGFGGFHVRWGIGT